MHHHAGSGSGEELAVVVEDLPGRGCGGFGVEVYSPAFLKQCPDDAGAIVIVDESDSSCWADGIKWGTDGIQTDDPEGPMKVLDAKSAEKPAAK